MNIKIISIVAIAVLTPIIIIIFNYFRNSKKIHISNNRTIIVKKENIFDEDRIVVIPVNRYFDMTLENNIISLQSLHGNFIKKYENQIDTINKQIDTQLRTEPFELKNRLNGKQKEYPVGTTVHVLVNDKEYYLLALTTFDDSNVAFLSESDFFIAIGKLLNYANKKSQGKSIAMPIIGSGLSRIRQDKQHILNTLINCINFSDYIYPKEIVISIYPPDSKEISLAKIE